MPDYDLGSLKVLVVDDNKHTRALIKSVLRALGVRKVEEAGDGDEAFKRLRNFSADVVICDWLMEPVDGLAFTRRVRTDPQSPNPYVNIVLVTGYTGIAQVEKARDAGINEFVAKPITARALFSRIRSIIERPRPYVRTKDYFGPCRRRHQDARYKGPDRRISDLEEEDEEETGIELEWEE